MGRFCGGRSGSGVGFELKEFTVLDLYPYTLQSHPSSASKAAPWCVVSYGMLRIANLSLLDGGSREAGAHRARVRFHASIETRSAASDSVSG
jgi:hypothetical protein